MRSFTMLIAGLIASVLVLSLQAQDAGKKQPVPDQAAQAKSQALVYDLFKEDIDKAKEPDAKAKLAANLLQQGKENRDADRYVLFREARKLASEAGDPTLTLLIVDEITKEFDVNALELKAASLTAVAEHQTSKITSKALVDLLMPMIADALDADNYDAAFAFGKVAETAAKKSKVLALVTAVQKRNEEVQAVHKGFARLQAYLDTLKKNPKDGEANLELGKYYALFKGRWEKALPFLAVGNDQALKTQAASDLENPKDTKTQLLVADGWWELAKKEKDPAQLQLQRRAMHWYEQAVGGLAGLNRTKALKRIDVVSARLAGSSVSEGPVGPVGELKKLEGHTDEIKSVALSQDGRYAVSGGGENDRSVRVWDLATGKDLVLKGHTKQVWGVAFHPNNRQVFSVSWDASARQWDTKTGNELKKFTHRLDLNAIALSRDGTMMLTASDDHMVHLWNTSTGDEAKSFPGHTGFVYAVAFAPDGRHIASGSVDKTVRVFDLTTGNQVKLFEGSSNAITNIAFTADSRYVLSSGDNVIHMWDLTTGKEARKFEGHAGLVQAMAISPDGRRLLTGGDDKTIRYWDVATGKELAKLTGHTDNVTSVGFSSDGRRAISGSYDRTVRLWGLPAR